MPRPIKVSKKFRKIETTGSPPTSLLCLMCHKLLCGTDQASGGILRARLQAAELQLQLRLVQPGRVRQGAAAAQPPGLRGGRPAQPRLRLHVLQGMSCLMADMNLVNGGIKWNKTRGEIRLVHNRTRISSVAGRPSSGNLNMNMNVKKK